MANLLAVCVVHEIIPDSGRVGSTAIDKRPVAGPVSVGQLGLAGDVQAAIEFHGGIDRAVYAYAQEDVQHWAKELGRDLPPGIFGENLRTVGVDVSAAVIGQRWQIGEELILEVSCPRIPCATFARFLDEPQWVKRFTEWGAPGSYFRVLAPGSVAAGDEIFVHPAPAHGVSIGRAFRGLDAQAAAALLDSDEVQLADWVQDAARTALARG